MYLKSLTITKAQALPLTKFIVLLSVATLLPAFIHLQYITGPIVNAILFISAALLGVEAAILIGLIPSLVALSMGLLPAVLAPMVPFIMVSNTIMIIIFAYFWQKNFWSGMIMASLLKFAFLFSASSLVINLLLKKEIAAQVAAMMSWPQLLTALTGGLIALAFLKGIKKIS